MKNLTKVIFLLFLTLTSLCSQGQNTNRSEIIRDFVDSLLSENDVPISHVKEKFLYVPIISDSLKFKQNSVLMAHLGMMKEKYSPWYKEDKGIIVSYKDLPASKKVSFDKKILSDIYAVLFNNGESMYFLFNKDKISSFDYITKGTNGPSYFLSYD